VNYFVSAITTLLIGNYIFIFDKLRKRKEHDTLLNIIDVTDNYIKSW